jgi:hypothetical protein
MITLEFISQQWNTLDKRDDLLAAHQFDFIVLASGSPLIIKDINGLHHLLIPIEEKEKVFDDKRSSGVQIIINNWGEEGKNKRFIDVICLKPHLNSLFDMIVFDILKNLEANITQPDKICRNVISRWRDLLSKDPVTLPEKNELIGILGELCVLRLMVRYDPSAVDLWVGPDGARFDFINESISLEVKTTLQRKGCILTIHGHKQLEPIYGSGLVLTVLKMEEVPVGGESILDLANSLIDLGVDSATLFSKLNKVGITAANIKESSSLRILLAMKKTYLVNNEFPAITGSSFIKGGLPNGVIDLTYQIDLSSEPPYPLTDEQMNSIIQQLSTRGQ